MTFGKVPMTVLVLAGLLFSGNRSLAQAAADAGPTPFTCLYDTAKGTAAPLTGETVEAHKGWTAIAEDTLTHPFAGDAAFMNDRVAVVFRTNSTGVEVYSRSPAGLKQRATLLPLGIDGTAGTISAIKIIENSQASVMLEASVTAKSGAIASYRFRLTAGESLLEVRGAQGAGRLRVCDQAQYVVVPDFFANDMVIDPAVQDRDRIGLPAENSVLGLTDNGNAVVACVWKSTRQNVDLLLSIEQAGRKISGYEIDLPPDNKLWIAVMEGAGIWHALHLSEQKAPTDLPLEWKPPIPARWRAAFVASDGTGVSTYFADPEAGAEPENAKSNGSCRFDVGRPVVRVIEPVAAASPRMMVVYPVERTRTTPLTAFCLVDVMRNALGVGPCQYVLDAEGLGNSESPTPDQVTNWVEKQFEKKPSKREADTIREQLEKMTLQVKRTDERVAAYVAFAAKLKQVLTDQAKDPEDSAKASHLFAILDHMIAPPTPALPAVEKLAAEIAAQAEKDDALAKCQTMLSAIRTAGASQDYALAKLRMAARRLKQEARTLAAADPKSAAFAGQIQQQAEQMLVKK